MMPGSKPDSHANELFAHVLDSLRQSRALLLDPNPQDIDRCRMLLAQCANRIQSLAGVPAADYMPQLGAVRNELSAISQLLNAAAMFRRDMLKAIERATPAQVIPIHGRFPDAEKVPGVHILG